MANIRIKNLPADATPNKNDRVPLDNATTRSATIEDVVKIGRPFASQAEAEAGVDFTKAMNPLTTAQAIAAQGAAIFQPLNPVLSATTASFTTADESKLDGVAAGADVTANALVTATGSTTARSLADRFADLYSARDFGLDPALIDASAASAFFLAEGDALAVSGSVGKLYWGPNTPRLPSGNSPGDQGSTDYGFSVISTSEAGGSHHFALVSKVFTGERTDTASPPPGTPGAPFGSYKVGAYFEAQRGAGSDDGIWALNSITTNYNLDGPTIGYELDMNNHSGIDPGLDSHHLGLSVVNGAEGRGGTAIEINRNGDYAGNQWNQGLHIREVLQRGIDFTNCGNATGIWADNVIKLARVDNDGPVAQLSPYSDASPTTPALYLTNAANSQVLMSILQRGEIVVGSPSSSGTSALSAKGIANGDNVLYLQRNTDSAPAGSFLACANAANNALLFVVDHNSAVNEANLSIAIGGSLTRVLKGAPDSAGPGASVLCVFN